MQVVRQENTDQRDQTNFYLSAVSALRYLLNDDVPGVDSPWRGHEVREDGVGGKDVPLALHGQLFDHRVVGRRHVVELLLLAAL